MTIAFAMGTETAGAQVPRAGAVSFGVVAGAVTVKEEQEKGDSGFGSAIRIGFPLPRDLTLETRIGYSRIHHASVSATYKLWEANLGLRYHPLGTDRAFNPFVEALSAVQVGQIDRGGFTPDPDLTGAGGAVGLGFRFRLPRGFHAALGAEAGLTWLLHGRVANGDWLRLDGNQRVRTRTTRIQAGIDWSP